MSDAMPKATGLQAATECLREDTIAAFVGGGLAPEEVARVEAHVARCDACRGIVADAAYGAIASHDGVSPLAVSGTKRSAEAPPPALEIPAPGALVATKYRVERELGRGGMGVVLAATHIELGHRVALKVLFETSAPGIARFLREARTCARLTSDHVARVSDVGRLPSGAPYIGMEYLTGSDLEVIARERPIAIAEAAAWVIEACAGIGAAHAEGVVHRDLKLANLFLAHRADGAAIVKVLDFGVSKAAHDDARGAGLSLTTTAAVIGTPLYMSPEQIKDSKDVDYRTDIWSLGVILYRLLCGHVPFRATSITALAVEIAQATPRAPSKLRAEVPPALDAIVLRCLEKDPRARYGSVRELAAALAPFAGTRDAAMAPSLPRATRHAGLAIAFVAGAIVAAGLGAARLVWPHREPSVTPAPTGGALAPIAPSDTSSHALAPPSSLPLPPPVAESAATRAPAAPRAAASAPAAPATSRPATNPPRPALSRANPGASASAAPSARPPRAIGPTDTPD
jgi:serine/threonine-protein kinase